MTMIPCRKHLVKVTIIKICKIEVCKNRQQPLENIQNNTKIDQRLIISRESRSDQKSNQNEIYIEQ